MLQTDDGGFEFSGPKEAYEQLRARAQRAIVFGDLHGFDVRRVKIRLRDDAGGILFEGTTEEASRLEIDGRVFLARPAK